MAGKLTDGYELIDSGPYGDQGPPHETWTKLRAESPVHYCENESYPPFWAVTRHADICEISRQPDLYSSYPGITLQRHGIVIDRSEGVGAMRTIIEMDPPAHRSYRKVASPWFTPRALGRVDAAVDASARSLVDALVAKASSGEGECDFAIDVATAHPLRILSTILGVPREQEPAILELTNQLFAADDEDLQREGEDRNKAIEELGLEMFQLFSGVIEDRRANPRDDLATVLANGQVDGEPMGLMETLGYYLITFTAGHDTTKNALAGGLSQLAQNPAEFQKVKNDPDLVPSLVEEVVRWASPVNYMRRTATEDTEIGGQKISKGDFLILFYASANRDDAVFDDPFTFKADRNPNRHLGFGYGEHFCLGAHLARRSQQALFSEITRRLDHIELTGDPEWIRASFVVGLKHLPIRYRVSKDA
jgi:cytochrome P450